MCFRVFSNIPKGEGLGTPLDVFKGALFIVSRQKVGRAGSLERGRGGYKNEIQMLVYQQS